MATYNTSYKYYFRVGDEIVCAGTVSHLFGLIDAEVELQESKPEWADGSADIAELACTPAEAAAWLKQQQDKGIPTPLATASAAGKRRAAG